MYGRRSSTTCGVVRPASKLCRPAMPTRFIHSMSFCTPSQETLPFIQCHHTRGRAESGGDWKLASNGAGADCACVSDRDNVTRYVCVVLPSGAVTTIGTALMPPVKEILAAAPGLTALPSMVSDCTRDDAGRAAIVIDPPLTVARYSCSVEVNRVASVAPFTSSSVRL